jgi:hypothetical protein
MEYVLLDRFVPILVVRRVGPMTAAAMSRLRGDANEHLRRANEKISIVYDVHPVAAGAPDAAARKVVADWWTQDAELLRRRCCSIEFAFPSAISRGVLTAILWIASPPIPTGVHATPRLAIQAAIDRTGQRIRLDASKILAELDAQAVSTAPATS